MSFGAETSDDDETERQIIMDPKPLQDALAALDPNNDEHWTDDGLPLVDYVSQVVGTTVRRAQIHEAAPTLTRESAMKAAADAAAPQNSNDAATDDAQDESTQGDPNATQDEDEQPSKSEDVLSMPFQVVMQSVDLLEKTIVALGERSAALSRRRQEIVKELESIDAKIGIADRQLRRLHKTDRGASTRQMQEHLATLSQRDREQAQRNKQVTNAIAKNLSMSPSEVEKALAETGAVLSVK